MLKYIKETFFHVWTHYLSISVVKLRLWNSWSNCCVVEILWLVLSQMNLKKTDTSVCVSIGQIERKSKLCHSQQIVHQVLLDKLHGLLHYFQRLSDIQLCLTIALEALWANSSQQTLEQQTGTAKKWLISCLFRPSTFCS